MRRWSAAAFVILCALWASEALAATRLIAVLPLDVTNAKGKLDQAARVSIEEMLRDLATNALRPHGWTILSGENTIQILIDNGVKPEECGNQACDLSNARELKTEAFISGSVQYVEGEFTASIRLIETRTGNLLRSERIYGTTVKALRQAFENQAQHFFAKAGLLTGGAPAVDAARPQVKRGQVTAAVGSLTVLAKPKEAVRLELVDPNGKKLVSGAPYENRSAIPGRWRFIARASGYEEEEQSLEVPPDDVTVVRFDLKLLGGLSVTGEPKGAAVSISGPDGFKDEGGLPWEATGLRSGTYQITVSRNGYVDALEQVEVTAGGTRRVTISLQKIGPKREKPKATPANEVPLITAAKVSKPGYDLSSTEVLRKVVVTVKDNFVDPKRFAPKEMLLAGLKILERSRIGLQVEPVGPGQVKLTCGGKTQEFSYDDVDSIWMLPHRVRPMFAFLQSQVGPEYDRRDIELAFINGMLGSVDAHSNVLSADAYRELKVQTKGEFGGVGFVVKKEDPGLVIRKVLKNTPAARSGLQKGDVIVRIDATETSGLDLNQAVAKMRGKPGSELVIGIRRGGGAEQQKRLVRELISIQSVTSELLAGGVGLVRLSSFNGTASRDVAAAIRELKERSGGELKGLVLDLRSNPGGLLEQAVQVSDQFLAEGTIVTTAGMSDKLREVKTARNDGGEGALPLVVLVNEHSASASEIVAGALKLRNRAVVLGRQTFGKGSVQVLYDVPEPGTKEQMALKLTISQYLAGGEHAIDGVGLAPDIELAPYRAPGEPVEDENEASYTSPYVTVQRSRTSRERAAVSIPFLAPDEELDDDHLASDPQVQFARELLLAAPATDRSSMLRRAEGFLSERRAAAERKLKR